MRLITKNSFKSILLMAIFFIVVIAVVITVRQGFMQSNSPLVDPSHPKVLAGQLPEVTLYSTDWCTYCKTARLYFNGKHIPFVEKDIEKNAAANKEFKRLGGNGVPLITIDNQRMQGFDSSAFKAVYLKIVEADKPL